MSRLAALPRLRPQHRTVMTMGAAATAHHAPKREGDISSVFVSLSGTERAPLPDRFRALKRDLVAGHEAAVAQSWGRLLRALREENEVVRAAGPAAIPSVEFRDLKAGVAALRDEIRKRGALVIRGVVDEAEARSYKDEIEAYVRRNPSTKAFPPDNPQVYELYWSPPQIRARAHPNMLKTQETLMRELWHASTDAAISMQPLTYADRLRLRQPGDATFALGPHVDGGSVERWERDGYGRGGTYDAVFRGDWEAYDPWDATARVGAVQDLYNGAGACSMFRMFQGWLSMSACGPREGTLLVNPLVQLSTAYFLLRPFFRPRREVREMTSGAADGAEGFLAEDNWAFAGGEAMSSELQGATPGHCQELSDALHPHLRLGGGTMVHVPRIRPGDYVAWHGDQVHAVDAVHRGAGDSSVLYVPVCPATDLNVAYLARQREAFLSGLPGPDFPGGKGESEHVGRPGEEAVRGAEARRAMGLERLLLPAEGGEGRGERELIERANRVLGF
ncbi:hypothetical protein CGRA01v4_14991 [Colletotrichum graminicola]|uniref:DUF1479 domain-containing protein n=1 Tax=Colletotrichum graminicola (strain M1.001 / M2 / FGSC 10212) TaxID=645133 RepID=E3QZH9_COLGM|nr:uncharacterized protein GLRG_11412 [Colletotrichum graminicola M1.001]EFQ36267.1 hypothetical protein GLRG_11412 [Colletotrichum graminicola M1.001]WDK23699.1 hypothetical protein CGRA01v4_14991 [Colletotrichum graminicola]